MIIWNIFEKIIHFFIYRIVKINISEKAWNNTLQFIKFGFVGILNNIISYGIYLMLVALHMHYSIANIIGFSISVLNSYYWNNKYVFVQKGKRNWWKTLIKTYISYAGTGILLSSVLLIVWVEILSVPKFIAPILNLLFTVPINYLVNKLWAYKK